MWPCIQQFGVRLTLEEVDASWTSQSLTEKVKSLIGGHFDSQKAHLDTYYDQIKKMVLLQTIDVKWKDHLQTVDHIREGVSLRGYAQKDPLIEYKKEAYAAYEMMDHSIKTDTLEKLFKVQIIADRAGTLEDDMGYGRRPSQTEMSGGQISDHFGMVSGRQARTAPQSRRPLKSATPLVRSGAKLGRNDPCYCGSGKKYKKCHGR